MTLTTRLHLADLFDGLQEEERQEFKEFEVDNKEISELQQGLEKLLELEYPLTYSLRKESPHEKCYEQCLALIPQNYGSRGITELSILLKFSNKKKIVKGRPHPVRGHAPLVPGAPDEDYFQDVVGLYLSALINNCTEPQVTLYTESPFKTFNHIGYRNNKKILVKGSARHSLGECMESGEIYVEGDAGLNSGYMMKGGVISVGDSFGSAGHGMKGGTVYVRGNAGNSLGAWMEDGEIHVQGNADDGAAGSMRGGKIHVAGNVETRAGRNMQEGELYVEGDANKELGIGMMGGVIYIKGNVQGSVGKQMEGGKIHIEGKYFPLSKKIQGGSIYHKGNPKVIDGERLI